MTNVQRPGRGVTKVKNLKPTAQKREPRHIVLGKPGDFKRVVVKIIASPDQIHQDLRNRPMPPDAGSNLFFLKDRTKLLIENARETAVDVGGLIRSLGIADLKWARITDKIREKDEDVEVRISCKRERELGHEDFNTALGLTEGLDDFVGFCWVQKMFHREPNGAIQASLNIELRRAHRMTQRPIQQVTAQDGEIILQEILE